MRIRKASSDALLPRINAYRDMSLARLRQISVSWVTEHEGHGLSNRLLCEDEGYRQFTVNTAQLIKVASFGEMGHKPLDPHVLFNGIDGRDYRIAEALRHWDEGGQMDPPSVFADKTGLYFEDGRHRTIAAFHLQAREIPLFIHVDVLPAVKRFINITLAV